MPNFFEDFFILLHQIFSLHVCFVFLSCFPSKNQKFVFFLKNSELLFNFRFYILRFGLNAKVMSSKYFCLCSPEHSKNYICSFKHIKLKIQRSKFYALSVHANICLCEHNVHTNI